MKIIPLNDWVLINRIGSEEKTAGGLYIPDAAREKPQWGIVEAAGPGAYETPKGKAKEEEKKFVSVTVKAGQKVLFEKYGAREFEIDGRKVLMLRERDILGIMEDGSENNNTSLEKKASSDLQKKDPQQLQKKG